MLILKTLVIVSHPEINNSQTQQFLLQGAKLQDVTWHHVEEISDLDVAQEQALLRENDRIIFQFPLYWYAAPEGFETLGGRSFDAKFCLWRW
jgi:Putative NADPH-quinone reductase (modulator of drug activity B)